MSNEIVAALISSIVGGLLVAVINYFFSRQKTDAETKKIIAEAEKTKIETIKLTKEIERLGQKVDDVTIAFRPNSQLIYNSSYGIQPFDFKGYSSEINGVLGQGKLNIETDFISIERTNAGGGFIILLRRYNYKNKTTDFLPKNELATGKRKIHVAFEAKLTKGECKVHIFFAPAHTVSECLDGIRVDEWKENQWTPLSLQYEFDPLIDCQLVIIPFENTSCHSFFLRNIRITEWFVQE